MYSIAIDALFCAAFLRILVQLYEPIASLDWQSTFVPLVFVLGVTAVKDAYDDYKRHTMDKKINNKRALRWNASVASHDWSL